VAPQDKKDKFKEWLSRYIVAELLGTLISVGFAYFFYVHSSHNYVVATAAGLIGEGIGFYGYFIVTELVTNGRLYKSLSLFKKIKAIVSKSSTNLIIEFAPAEIVDSIFIRPVLMFYVPHHIKPYALGFLVGKFSSDLIFYVFAIIGYELKKRIQSKTA
jgi:hypothetical protein